MPRLLALFALCLTLTLAACAAPGQPAAQAPAPTAVAPPRPATALPPAPTRAQPPQPTSAPTAIARVGAVVAPTGAPSTTALAAVVQSGRQPGGEWFLGNPDAKVTLIDYSDFL